MIRLAALLLFLAPLHSLFAQQHHQWDGTYTLVGEGQPVINSAIDRAIEAMSMFARPIARHRLLKSNKASQRLIIKPITNVLTIDYGDLTPVTTPMSGNPATWVTPEGETVRTEGGTSSNSLRQLFVAKDGKSEYLFHLGSDGATLTMEVIVTSPHLPAPVKYALNYRRTT